MTESPWAEVGTITVKPTDSVVEVGSFDLVEGADTLWVRMTNTGEESGWPWSYGVLSFKTEEGQPLGSIKAYNSYDGEVFRLGVGLAPSVRSGVLTFEPRGFNLAWVKKGNPWPLMFEATSGGNAVTSAIWNRDSENGIITPKVQGDDLDMGTGSIFAKNLTLTDGPGADVEVDVSGFQHGTWLPVVGNGVQIVNNVYSRTGNQVTVAAALYGISPGNTGAFSVGGLPYRCAQTNVAGSVMSQYFASPPTVIYVRSDLQVLNFYECRAANWAQASWNGVQSGDANLYFQGTYLTDDTTWKPSNLASPQRLIRPSQNPPL